MTYTIKQQMRYDLPQVGVPKFNQVHAHSTANPNSTAQNEADYMSRKDVSTGYYTHVVGNGIVIQTAPVNRGAYDVGGGYNYETYAAVELIESHSNRAEFERDYAIYCELLRDLANEAGVPVTVDDGNLSGIKTHNWCTHNQPNNASDHVDPLPYLAKWGIGLDQFRADVCNGVNVVKEEKVEQQKSEEEEDMTEFAFAFKGAMYYVTGSRMVALASANEWAVVQSMYAQTHNGKGILALDWSGNDATADAYFNICGRADDESFKQATTQGIEDIKAALK